MSMLHAASLPRTLTVGALACLTLAALTAAQAPPVISPQQPPAISAPRNTSVPSTQELEAPPTSESEKSGNVVHIPQLAKPEAPPIKSPIIPPGFFGCWHGDPGRFDSWNGDASVYDIGVPGNIFFCYQNHTIELQSAEIKISRRARIRDIARQLGLGYTTFSARGIKTDVYLVTTDTLRSRTYIDLKATEHLFYLIPIHFHEDMVEDEVSRLLDSGRLEVRARFLVSAYGSSMWGTWHSDFQRVANVPGATE